MKRLSILFLILFICQNCKKDLPSSTTIVKVNLTDENNNPLEGIEFIVGGFYYKGISAIDTFGETLITDKQGNLKFEMLVTAPTKYVTVGALKNSYTDKEFQIEVNGTFQKWSGTIFIKIGSENINNLKLVKQ